MSGQTIRRRRVSTQPDYPVGRFWLRFVRDGRHDLTVDPARCPRQIAARPHWTDDPDGEPVLNEMTGETVVLARCRCAP